MVRSVLRDVARQLRHLHIRRNYPISGMPTCRLMLGGQSAALQVASVGRCTRFPWRHFERQERVALLVSRVVVIARLNVVLQVALEAAEHDLALAGLEAVHHAGDGALQVRPGKQDQLLRKTIMDIKAGAQSTL